MKNKGFIERDEKTKKLNLNDDTLNQISRNFAPKTFNIINYVQNLSLVIILISIFSFIWYDGDIKYFAGKLLLTGILVFIINNMIIKQFLYSIFNSNVYEFFLSERNPKTKFEITVYNYFIDYIL